MSDHRAATVDKTPNISTKPSSSDYRLVARLVILSNMLHEPDGPRVRFPAPSSRDDGLVDRLVILSTVLSRECFGIFFSLFFYIN